MITTKPLDVAKARAIASRLDSEHDGEVLNAARALVRLAAGAGLKVQDLISGHHSEVGASSDTRQRPEPKRRPRGSSFDSEASMKEAAEAFKRAGLGAAFGSQFWQAAMEGVVRDHVRSRSAGAATDWRRVLGELNALQVAGRLTRAAEGDFVNFCYGRLLGGTWIPDGDVAASILAMARRYGVSGVDQKA